MEEKEIIDEIESIAEHLGCNKGELLHEFLILLEKILNDELENKQKLINKL